MKITILCTRIFDNVQKKLKERKSQNLKIFRDLMMQEILKLLSYIQNVAQLVPFEFKLEQILLPNLFLALVRL